MAVFVCMICANYAHEYEMSNDYKRKFIFSVPFKSHFILKSMKINFSKNSSEIFNCIIFSGIVSFEKYKNIKYTEGKFYAKAES